jgi:hypothetical protein
MLLPRVLPSSTSTDSNVLTDDITFGKNGAPQPIERIPVAPGNQKYLLLYKPQSESVTGRHLQDFPAHRGPILRRASSANSCSISVPMKKDPALWQPGYAGGNKTQTR